MSNKQVYQLDAYVPNLDDEMAHLFLLSPRSTAEMVQVVNRQREKLAFGRGWYECSGQKWTIFQEENRIFFFCSVFGEVSETLLCLRESISIAAPEKPNIFVMGVNVLGFNHLPSLPLAQRIIES